MKNLLLSISVLFCVVLSAQNSTPKIMETTYLDVHPTKINRFIELHKTMFDFTMGEERTLEDSWVYRHWYGSGATIILMDIYPSAEAAVKDDIWIVMRRKMAELSEDEKNIVALLQNHHTLGVDEIVIKLSAIGGKISADLLSLEFKGIVKSMPGSRYTLI